MKKIPVVDRGTKYEKYSSGREWHKKENMKKKPTEA